MKPGILRIVFALFLMSTVFSPIAVVTAQDATPVVPDPTETVAPTTEPETETPTSEAVTPEVEENEESTPSSNSDTQGRMAPQAEATGSFGVSQITWNANDKALTLEMVFFPGFIAEQNDTILVYYTSDSLLLPPGEVAVPEGMVDANIDPSSETITFKFLERYEVSGGTIELHSATLTGDVVFPMCVPSYDSYVSTAQITVEAGDYYPAQLTVEGPECPATDGGAVVSEVAFNYLTDTLGIQLYVGSTGVPAGTQFTVTYPADLVTVEPGPVEIKTLPTTDIPDPIVVATAEASEGVITITFTGVELPEEGVPPIQGYLNAALNTESCVPEDGQYRVEVGRLYFVASPGGTFMTSLPTGLESPFRNEILCNAAPASMTGELSSDGQSVTWTLETGDLLDGIIVQSLPISGLMTFDCDSMVVETTPVGLPYQPNCDPQAFPGVYIPADGMASATITVTAALDPEFPGSSVFSCVFVAAAFPQPTLQTARASDTAGVGATVCAEVFVDGGGDAITNTASADSVDTGDSLSYQMEFSTDSFIWTSIPVSVTLPEGFAASDAECTFEPAANAVGDCEVLADGTLQVGMQRSGLSEPNYDPASVTIAITGTVEAAPGAQLTSTVCGQRTVEDSGPLPIGKFVGSDEICAEAVTMVNQIATETPSPTATATETPSPTATATETPSPTSTVPVTETPSPTSTTAPEQKETLVRVETSDGSSLEGANWSLFAPIATQQGEGAYLTGTLDAANTALLIDVPAGEYRFVVAPAGVDSQEFLITITDESQEIVVQFAVAGTPEPTVPATPGETATAAPTATSTAGVSGLPETGSGAGAGSGFVMIAAIAAGLVALAGVGLRVRTER